MLVISLLILSFISFAYAQTSAAAIASQYSLTTSTTFPFPTATASSSDTQQLIVSQWGLGKGHIQFGGDNLEFVEDPFPNSTVSSTISGASSPVLQVTYPAGSFNNGTGGAQFYNLWNTSDGSQFSSMLLSYEVAFDTDFDWVQGGKLPGLRGGLQSGGCSGGSEADGSTCFSTRLMWRTLGAGEVYAYILTPDNLCSQSNIICDSEFGTSIQRGSYSFLSGTWNKITMLVQMNNPVDTANGNVQLYYNDLPAISQENLQIRNASSLNANGLFFSTFFGGDDDTWATPSTTHSYFRNFVLYGGSNPSTLTGQVVSSSVRLCIPYMAGTALSLIFAAFVL